MDISALLGLFRRRYLVIVLCVLVGTGAGIATWKQSTPVYRSESSVLLGLPGAQTTAEAAQGLQISSQLLQSYAEIVSSRSLAQDVKDRLGLPESVRTLTSRLSASVRPQTLYIVVSAKDPDPVRARSLADAATQALIVRMRDLQSDRDPATRVTATILDGAENGARISPRPKLDVALGLLVGLFVGLAVALVVDALDRTVKTAPQLIQLLDAPLLGVVPRIRRRPAISVPLENDAIGEAYRSLRTAVRFVTPDAPLRAFAITSPDAGEGKTTTAVNLAIAMAEGGERVVLIDADMRRSRLATELGIEGAVGLSDAIVGAVSLADVLQPWQVLTVLPAGSVPPNPSELLGSESMAQLVNTLLQSFDVVILDTPPALPVTDAVVLSTLVDGLIVVVRARRTIGPRVAELRRRLETVQVPVLGCVLNAKPTRHLSYDEYHVKTTT